MTETLHLAARIGIDWADAEHAVALQEAGSSRVEKAQLPHTPEALAEWASGLRQRFGGRFVGICLETSHGPLVHALLEYEFVVLYPVNPRALKRFRETFGTGGAKDDPDDAGLLLELLLKHEDRLRRWLPDDSETRALARLAQARRKAVDLRNRLSQQLRAELKGYFPQALDWAGSDLTRRLATSFLLKWPTLDAVQRATPQTLRKFYYAHNCRRGDLIEQRIEQIRHALPLTTDKAIVDTSQLTVQLLAQQIQALSAGIVRFEKEIAERFQRHPDAPLFDSLPGSGPALAPRLLTAFGSTRDRFDSASEVQQLSGIAPVTIRSGKSCRIAWRWGAPKFVRQTFHEFARLSMHQCEWARSYYELQRERGKGHHAAIRALAFKWIRIIYRCWKQRTPYDDARYLEALRRSQSPLVARLGLQTA
jgi:transposase